MTWLSAIIAVAKAVPEIIKLVQALVKAADKRKAQKDWDEFMDRFKKSIEDKNAQAPKP